MDDRLVPRTTGRPGRLIGVSTADPTARPEPTWASVPQIADQLHLPVTKVHQLIRDGQLLGIRRDGILRIPAEFVLDGLVVKGLPATLTLLRDNGYRDDEIVVWLFEADDSLPGSPISALRENRGREVHRRAQVAGF